MRKSKILLATVIVLFLTGCGKQTKLVCKHNANGIDETYNFVFSGNKISTMKLKYDRDVSNYSDEQIETSKTYDHCELLKGTMIGFQNAFKNCTNKIENKHILINSEFDVNKISDNVKTRMASLEVTKEDLEKYGYECTIEE